MTDMPWRLQLAAMAMQGDLARSANGLNNSDGSHPRDWVPVYFRMADAMLAEHERTAKVSAPAAKDKERIDELIVQLRKEGEKITRADCFGCGKLMNSAATELERMLNESK